MKIYFGGEEFVVSHKGYECHHGILDLILLERRTYL